MPDPVSYAVAADGQSVAYQVVGDGPLDIVFIPDWVTNLEVMREDAGIARFFERLASFGRLILFDKRGTGLSDPVPLGALPTPEQWLEDVVTVLDTIGSDRVAVFGHGEGGWMATLFAATHPNRCSGLILADTCARRVRDEDYPAGIPPEVAERYIKGTIDTWGTGKASIVAAPAESRRPGYIELRGRLERLAMSPAQFAAVYPSTYQMDTRHVLDTLRVPTLVLHRKHNRYMRVDNGRYLAEHIAGAEYVELDGDAHFFHAGDITTLLDHVQQFLTGTKETPDHHRVLATVLFTDIVESTELATRLGDRGWHELLEQHHALVREELARFRGREVDTAGDGFFATFDGPARGVRCALAIRDRVRTLGIEIRAGLHTGECELMDEKVGGIAVHIGARVAARAQPGQVLVSRTVTDLVAGSGLAFEELGEVELKGVPGRWALYAVC